MFERCKITIFIIAFSVGMFGCTTCALAIPICPKIADIVKEATFETVKEKPQTPGYYGVLTLTTHRLNFGTATQWLLILDNVKANDKSDALLEGNTYLHSLKSPENEATSTEAQRFDSHMSHFWVCTYDTKKSEKVLITAAVVEEESGWSWAEFFLELLFALL